MKDNVKSFENYDKNKQSIMEGTDAVILPSDQAKAKLSREVLNNTIKTQTA